MAFLIASDSSEKGPHSTKEKSKLKANNICWVKYNATLLLIYREIKWTEIISFNNGNTEWS